MNIIQFEAVSRVHNLAFCRHFYCFGNSIRVTAEKNCSTKLNFTLSGSGSNSSNAAWEPLVLVSSNCSVLYPISFQHIYIIYGSIVVCI